MGYVASSPYTVAGESYSAGRLYDKIGDTADGTVLFVLPKGVLCYVNEECHSAVPRVTIISVNLTFIRPYIRFYLFSNLPIFFPVFANISASS